MAPTLPAAGRPLGAGRPGPLPLSFDQERMWLFDRQLATSISYDDPIVARLRGPLRLAAVTAALGRVVARHESLRTRFPLKDGLPRQLVDPYRGAPVRLVDLSGRPESASERLLAGVVAAESARPFDLGHGPLYRATVVRLGTEDHLLVVTVHHLAADLWSMTLIVDELSQCYRAAHAGAQVQLPRPTSQPADLAVRERERLTPRRASALRSFWRQRLAGARAAVLPVDRPRPPRPHLGVYVYRSQLTDELTGMLRRFSRLQAVTLFVTMLTGFHALLVRWTGQPDLVVRSVAAGRRGPQAERAVGLLTRCLVLPLDATGDPTVRELLARTREALLDALDGAELPFAEIVALVDPGRDLEPSPLRQLGLSVHNVPRTVPSLTGLTLAGPPVPPPMVGSGVSEADIWLEVFDAGDGPLALHLKLDDRLFTPESLGLTARRLTSVLTQVVTRPDTRLSELDLPAGDRRSPPALAGTGAEPAVPAAEPATVRMVTELVESLLGVVGVSADDNFFRLGGSSLDAVRLISRLDRQLGARITLPDLAAAPTIGHIARTAERAGRRPGP